MPISEQMLRFVDFVEKYDNRFGHDKFEREDLEKWTQGKHSSKSISTMYQWFAKGETGKLMDFLTSKAAKPVDKDDTSQRGDANTKAQYEEIIATLRQFKQDLVETIDKVPDNVKSAIGSMINTTNQNIEQYEARIKEAES
ncbi:MAG: hypothetical protein IIA83_12710, partial [Thaumarchaeota archaeon]|nr:hypothetical protein [Nitrososphaerota archaeon]